MSTPAEAETVRALLDRVTLSRHALESARRLYEDRLAPDFSPFEFFRTGELMWSRLFGWLLDPKGSHAQKGRFLHLFTRLVSHVGQEWSDEHCDKAVLRLEHGFDDGRIDIIVRCGDRLLIIENKPYAADQDRQLLRYFQYADGRSDDRLKAVVVYLTAEGTRPHVSSLSAAEVETRTADGTLVLQSYRGLASAPGQDGNSWLDACRLACRSPRVAGFIEEIQQKISAEFSGINDMSEANELVSIMSESPDRIKSAFQIARSFNNLRETLCERLVDQLNREATQSGIKSPVAIIQSNGLYLNFKFDEQSPYVIRFYTSNVVAIGLLREDEKDSGDQSQIALGRGLAEKLRPFGAGKNWGLDKWAWVTVLDETSKLCPLPSDFWMNPKPWMRIAAADRHESGEAMSVAGTIIQAVHSIMKAIRAEPDQ